MHSPTLGIRRRQQREKLLQTSMAFITSTPIRQLAPHCQPSSSCRYVPRRHVPFLSNCRLAHLKVKTDGGRLTPTAKAREVTADELELVLQANERPVLVDAYAGWCGPCQYMAPHLDDLAARLGHKLDVLKLDTEKFPDLATSLMVRGLPTLFFIRDGKLRHRMEGAITADDLEKLADYVLFDGPPPTNVPS